MPNDRLFRFDFTRLAGGEQSPYTGAWRYSVRHDTFGGAPLCDGRLVTELLPPPLVPAGVDCTDLDGFMLNVERLMASELVALASHEAVAAALFLWCRAWKQKPAASLPNDDRVLAAFAKLPLPRFKKLRADVMRGFVLCRDGRFYHQVLADEAIHAYERKQSFRRKRETDAERLRNWRTKRTGNDDGNAVRNDDETRFVAEGQGQGHKDPIPTLSGDRDLTGDATPLTPADAAVMGDQEILDFGVEQLKSRDKLAHHTAQTFLSSRCKLHGTPAVVAALREMATLPVVSPRAVLDARLQEKTSGTPFGRRPTSAVERVKAAAEDRQRRAAAAGEDY